MPPANSYNSVRASIGYLGSISFYFKVYLSPLKKGGEPFRITLLVGTGLEDNRATDKG
jgi:hypothetical protein